ncbi:MAG: DUF3108 domain-containing protein [Alphaproteobacteria bacterium]
MAGDLRGITAFALRYGRHGMLCGFVCIFFVIQVAGEGFAQEGRALRQEYQSSKSASPPFRLRDLEHGLTYRLWVGGFRSASFDLILSPLTGEHYRMEVDGWLEGLADKLISMDLGASVRGERRDGELRPHGYRSRFLWGEKRPREQGVAWLLDGEVLLSGRAELPKDYDKHLLAEAVDPLSFLSEFFLPIPQDWERSDAQASLCGGSRTVFEGRYLFTLTPSVAEVREQDFGKKYSPYRGRMLRCYFDLTPIYGFDDPDREEQWSRNVELWLIALEGDEGGVIAPVRISFRTQLGGVLAYLQLAEYKSVP